MTDEKLKAYAKVGALAVLLTKCDALKVSKDTRSMAEEVKEAAEAFIEVCDEEEDDT